MSEHIPHADQLTVRWTIGSVRPRGFEMLRLSIACAARLFGSKTRYVVCVNTISAAEACRRTGPLPVEVEWIEVTRADLPRVLRPWFDEDLSEGTGWKLAPLRLAPDRYELALDNDCILWRPPAPMLQWLQSADGGLLAEDVARCLGVFDAACPPGSFNSGIRGLAPDSGFETALAAILEEVRNSGRASLRLTSETDEQGLQAAAVCRLRPLFLVTTDEVSICSPFWPRSSHPGTCGAHFVGMNAHHIPWDYYDRPADVCLHEHWERHRPSLYERAALCLP